MAREEAKKEDLIREATALRRRLELRIRVWPEPIVIGFRRDGSASFFFGEEPVFQFNTQLELRRVFNDGKLIKAVKGKLVSMTKVRTETQLELRSRELKEDELRHLLGTCAKCLQDLNRSLAANEYEVIDEVNDGTETMPAIVEFLASVLEADIQVASVPNVR